MIIQCSECRTRYHYDEARFAGAPAKKIRCTKCATIFEIRNPAVTAPPPPGFQPDETAGMGPVLGSDDFSLDTTVMGGGPRKRPPKPGAQPGAPPPPPPPPQPGRSGTAEFERPKSSMAGAPERRLRLPDGERLSLACIAGPEAGRIFELDRPRMVMGRSNADVTLNDPECSRQHAAIEVADDRVYLIDLQSTNGTYVGERRITQVELDNRSEFDIGASTLMLIRTKKE